VSKDIWVHPSRESDLATLDPWLRETPANLLDPDILQYTKNIRFLTASHEGQPLVHMPVQSVLMLESLAVKPGATELEVAKSIAELIRYAVKIAMDSAMNEVYFICKDENVNRFAERHGFECLLADEKRGKLYRIKVGKL